MAEEKKVEKPKATLIKHSKKTLEPITVTAKPAIEEKPVEKKRVVVVKKKKVVVKRPTAFKPETVQRETPRTEPIQTPTPKRANAEIKTDHTVKTAAPAKPEKVLEKKIDNQTKPVIPQRREESALKDKEPSRPLNAETASRRPSSNPTKKSNHNLASFGLLDLSRTSSMLPLLTELVIIYEKFDSHI